MKILIGGGKKYLVKSLDTEFHTSDGVIAKNDLKKNGVVVSSKGKKFTVLEAGFVDLWEQLKRGPQIVLPKDIGLIITKTGVNKGSKVVDAGGGTGSLSGYLAHLCKEVTCYEKEKELISVLEHNKKLLGLKNWKIKNDNVYAGITEKNLDLVTLDLARPWEVIESASKALKLGGYLVAYLPNVMQVKMLVDALKGSVIKVLEVEELIERKWRVESQVVRPEYDMLGHSGFLVFCRRLG